MPYTTKLSQNDQNINFTIENVHDKDRGSEKYRLLRIIVDNRCVGEMHYWPHEHGIYIARVDNFTLNEEHKINGVGRLCVEHALRESLCMGLDGRIELDAIEASAPAHFRLGFQKRDRKVGFYSLSDTLNTIDIINTFNPSADQSVKENLCTIMREKLFFSLFNSKQIMQQEATTELLAKLASEKDPEKLNEIKKELFTLIKDEIVKQFDSLYKTWEQRAAVYLNKDPSQTTLVEVMNYGTLSPDNEPFEKWLSEQRVQGRIVVTKEECIKQNMEGVAMYLTPDAIEKKKIELKIEPESMEKTSALSKFKEMKESLKGEPDKDPTNEFQI